MRTKEEILEELKNCASLEDMNRIGMEVQCDIRDVLERLANDIRAAVYPPYTGPR